MAHSCTAVVPLFKNLTDEARTAIDALTHEHQVQKGTVLISPDTAAHLLVVAQGKLKTYQLATNGKEQLLRVDSPGDYEGEAGLLNIANPNVYTEALTTATVCTISAADFQQLLMQQPQISLQLLTENARKMQALEKQAGYLGNDSINIRLTHYLLDLRTAAGKDTVTVPMAWTQLADYLGTTPETVSRTLKRLADEKLIQRTGKQVTILNAEDMEDFVW